MNDRQRFIESLFRKMDEMEYVLLKHIDHSVVQVDEYSDLDILISKSALGALTPCFDESPVVKKLVYLRKSTMTQIFLFFKDGSFLQLDFLFGFYRKDLKYLDERTVFEFARRNHEGIRICSPWHLLEHLFLFNFLNFSGIAAKYIRFFEKYTPSEKKRLLDYLDRKYELHLPGFEKLEVFDGTLRRQIIRYLKHKKYNRKIARLKNKLNYGFDLVKGVLGHRGFTITFSGVDGAGKSTILREVKGMLEKKYRRNVVILRHRPSVLPILSAYKYGKTKAEERAAVELPRQGRNKSSIGSFARFLYYYCDYLFGQFYVKIRYHWRGYIVLYDRYYFDFIVDPKRSNIRLDQAVPRFLYRFVHHPDLNLFLYAEPETILKRKQELDRQSIRELTQNYKSLFDRLGTDRPEKYIPIKNVNKEETLKEIIEHYEMLV